MNRGRFFGLMDLYLVWGLIIALVLLFLLDPTSTVTLLFCVPFLLFIPGYLVARIVQRRFDLETMEMAIIGVTISGVLALSAYGLLSLISGENDLAPSALVLAGLSGLLSIIVVRGRLSGRMPRPSSSTMEIGSGIDWRKRSLKGKALIVFSVLVIIIVISASIGLLSTANKQRFTEFYVLGNEGGVSDYPHNFTVGMEDQIILGIANHEGEMVDYFVEVWLVNYTLIDNAVQVEQMYFVQDFNVSLNNKDVDLNDQWQSQFETSVELNFSVSGPFFLFFMLFKGEAEPLPEPPPLDPLKDYAKTSASWRIVECVNNQIQFLRLEVQIAP